ncbi:hypothetical protein HN937_20165 [Candidatus Poribacteria bacterium]|jgi:hypothetical protein|nr:hypothetical protein [Candidatus Poribacteria bacterium]
MTVTVSVEPDWPSGIPARSGLPPRNVIPRVLDAQQVWLAAGRRHMIYVPMAATFSTPLTDSEASSGDKEQIRIKVPPWTDFCRWWVIADGDDPDAACYAQRTGETYSHKIFCPGNGDEQIASGIAWPSDGDPDGNSEPQHIDAGVAAASWAVLTIDVWLDGAEIWGIAIECLRMIQITG